jgi:hypothetical protein
LEDWQQSVGGALHAGGWLNLFYDLDRLPQCRGTHNGFPAWDTVATIKFLPNGQTSDASVREFVTDHGTPTRVAVERQVQMKIPAEATSIELWFHNYSGAANSCEAWDSNDGANYHFDILPSVTDPRCQNVESWTQVYGGKPTCTAYTVDEQYDATHCEIYLQGFGHGFEGHYGIPFDWLEAYLVTGAQDGEILNVGMFTGYVDPADGETHVRYSLGSAVDVATYKTGFTFHSTGMQSLPTYEYAVTQIAFFIDVRRPSGKIVRLWQSHGGVNYSWEDAFGAGVTTTSIPYGNMKWAADSAAIFDSRNACK